MAQYLNLPSGNSFLLNEGEDPQQGWLRALKEHPEQFGFAKSGPKPEGGFIPALSAGLSRLAGETALTAGKLGILDLPRAEELYSLQQKKAEQIFKPAEGGWTESPWQKFKEVAGGSAAYMLAPAAAALAGAAAPVSVPVIGTAGLAAGLASLGQFTGSNIAAQMAEGKTLEQASGATAAVAAVPQAALDVLSFRMIPGLQRFFGATGKEITEAQAKALAEQTLKQKVGDYAVATGRTMGVEGVTEVAQDVIEKLQAGAEIADPKAREDYLESLIGGAALAAVLGPLGRGLERRQISARGQELEKERLAAEAAAREKAQQEALAAQTEFRLAPPEGPMGPSLPADTQTQRIQARLSEIENEVAAARQAKDMDALLNLMRERNTLEAQAEELAPEQTAFERRRGMEQQQSALESLEAQLQAEARQATNVADKRAVLERLVAVQKQRRDLEKEFERAEAKGEIPTLVEHKKLLDAEKRAVRALQAAEEKGDAAGQLKAAAKLEELQGQLGLFGMESFAAQEQDAARSRAQEALQASGRTLRLPAPVAPTIPLGSTRTAPVQETLFFDQPSTEDVQQRIREIEAKIEQATAAKDGRRVYELLQERQELEPKLTVPTQSFERQYEVSTDQTGMPQQQLQQAVSTLATKPDLKPEDRALLERVQEVATPASGLPQTEAIQAKIDALDQRSAALTRELEKQKSRPGRFATLRQDLQRQFDAAQRRVAELSEKLRIYEKDADKLNTLLKTAKTEDEAKTIRANKATEEANIANLKQNLDAANTEVIQLDNRLKAVARRVDATDAKSVRKIAALERRLAAIARQKSQLSETPTAQPSLLERLSTTGAARARQRVEEIQKEIDAIERGTQADTTLSGRQKLDRIAQLKEEQARLRQETVSLRQRITDWLSDTARGLDNTNSRQALEDALQQVEAAQRGFDAQQTDLFAGTEAERSVEFQTPEQFQKFMASEELNNLRRQQGLLKPTVAYLQKQASKIQTILKDLNAKLKLFTNLQKARTESAEKAQNAAKAKYAEAWQKVLEGLPEEHSKYAYAKLELENATATYAGLIDLQKAAMDALDSDLRKDSVWAAYDAREKARFFAALQAPKQAWEAALTRLTELRQQIAKAQIGEATDPYTALWPEYSAAQKEAQKAYEAFQKVIRDRKKIVPPANAVVADKEIKNFLAQDAELTEMLIAQQRAIYKFERMLFAAQEQLETAKASLRQDPLLKNYFDALEEAISIAADSTKAPVTLMESALTDSFLKLPAAIKKANEELNKLQQQTAPSPGATAGERYERYTDPNRAAEIKKELELLQTERDKLANALRNKEVIKTDTGVALVPKRKYLGAAPEKFAGIVTAQELLRTAATSVKDERITALTPKTRVALLDGRIEELQRELDSIDRYKLSRRESRLEEVGAAAERQQTTRDEMRAENERLAREAEATTRVTFEPLRPEQQRALDEAKQQLDTLIKNKQAAIEKKENQKKNFRLSSELQKAVAEGKKTKAEAVEEQRTADIKKISDMFDTQIEQKQAQIRAIRGVSRPSERREAQARQTQALQRDIGQPVTMSQEMQEELLTTAEKKAIDDGTKTLEQVMEARGRAGRTGKAVVHVRTGRVSEARRAVSKRDLTKAEQDVENAEANRLSAQFAADAEERYLKGLLTYAKTQLDLDLSGIADDVVAVEYAILNEQAVQEERQKLKRKPTTKEQEKTAQTVAESLDRVISSEYTDRENTPLDETTTAAVNKGNLIQALTSLAENGSTPFVRMVAKRLLPMVENTSLETASLEGKGGEFDPNTNTITLNKDALTEEDLLHEAGHAATNTVASYEPKEFGMTRRQFLKGAASGLTAMKLPSIGENLSLEAQERLFFEMLDGWRSWTEAANKIAPALDLDPYSNLSVADRNLRGFLTQLEYNEVSNDAVVEMLENGGLKKLQSAINASQRAIMAEATKTGEGKAEAQKETFTPTKEQLDARTALEKLYAKMQSRPEFKDEYANISFKEFVSELLSNQQVRDKINQTAGLLRRIYEGFLRMLGIEPTTLSDKAVEQAFAMFSPSPEIFYHGTKQTFTQFDPTRGSTPGSWFTKNKAAAGEFGTVMAVTLDIKNPATLQDLAIARREVAKTGLDATEDRVAFNRAVIDNLEAKGFDGIRDEKFAGAGGKGGDVVAIFRNSQVKPVVSREERLASIMRGVFPGTSTKFSSAVPQGVQDAVNKTIARTATLGDKLMANTMGLRLRTFIADQWAPVEALLKMGVEKGKIKEAQALQMRVYMRLFSNQQEYTNAALLNGVPELMKDKTGVRNIEGGDEKANARTIAAALSKAKALGNEQAIERVFTLWMASLRAQQDGVGFEKLNFKNPPTAAELAALDQMFKDNPEVKAAFDEARALYKEHNKRLLKLQVETGAMSQTVADELGKGDYIGYYRVNNNGVVELMLGGSRPMRIGSVVDQPYLKELVGGEQHILPFFSSMVQNTSMLMTIALKNMQNTNTSYMFQDLGLGKIHSVPDGKQPPMGKIRFKQGGNDYWFEADESAFEAAGVPADLMMQGLQGVKTAVPALVRGLAVPANFLRKAIRRVPTYTLRQTIRDPMHAWMVTGGKFTPILSTWKELAKGMTGKSDTQLTLQQAAVIGNNVYSGDAEGVADMLRTLTSEPSKFSQTMMKFDEFAMRGEAATRAVLYDMFRKKGMGHVEALLNTAETMNFSRRGTSASLAWLSMLTPFFNAQIQGLDSVYRALKGDSTFEEKMNARNTLLKRGALMAFGTMMYALLMEDDEAYKNATPAERYGNWFVRVPGTDKTVRVPIPFELGLIFKSMPEAFMNTAFGDTKSSEAVKALAKQIWMSTPGGIPTAVKGPIELMANYSFYSDQPIETTREQAMDVDQRYRTGTTELAKLLGKAGVLSPVQIDHLVRSYLSSAGIVLASMANFALRPLTSREGVEKPEMALEEMPLFGSMFQPRTGRGMVNAAFDDMHRLERAANTYKTLAASDPKAAQEYANDYAREIGLASFAGRFRQQMGEFAKYKRMIAANPDLTPAEKRQQIEAVKEQEIRYSTMLRKAAA